MTWQVLKKNGWDQTHDLEVTGHEGDEKAKLLWVYEHAVYWTRSTIRYLSNISWNSTHYISIVREPGKLGDLNPGLRSCANTTSVPCSPLPSKSYEAVISEFRLVQITKYKWSSRIFRLLSGVWKIDLFLKCQNWNRWLFIRSIKC